MALRANSLFSGILLTALLGFTQPAAAIYKCTDSDGNVGFQDRPCKTTDVTDAISLHTRPSNSPAAPNKSNKNLDVLSKPDFEPVIIRMPAGDVILFALAWWDVVVTPATGNLPANVKIRSKPGYDPLSLSLTIFPTQDGTVIDLDKTIQTVKRIGQEFVRGSVEKSVQLRQIDTPIGPAVMANFNEEKYQRTPAPEGEFPSITVGQLSHKEVIIAITVLSNGTDSSAHDDAISVISAIGYMPRSN